jgi:hypothetical protein
VYTFFFALCSPYYLYLSITSPVPLVPVPHPQPGQDLFSPPIL